MKRIVTAFISCALLLGLTACSGGTVGEQTSETSNLTSQAESEPALNAGNDTLLLLQSIWESFPEEASFPAAGGDMEHNVMGGAGMVAVENTDYLCNILLFPPKFTGQVLEAASIGHMMNFNNITSGLYLLDEGTDLDAFTKAFEEKIENNHWLCGFPEKYLVMKVDENHLYLAYGFTDNILAMKDHISSQMSSATVLAEGDIV